MNVASPTALGAAFEYSNMPGTFLIELSMEINVCFQYAKCLFLFEAFEGVMSLVPV
jgi:hypothetical protein